MSTENTPGTNGPDDAKVPAVNIGNASNPGADDKNQPASNQLLGDKAEKYLREVASIEDMPDEQDQQDADDTIEKEKK